MYEEILQKKFSVRYSNLMLLSFDISNYDFWSID